MKKIITVFVLFNFIISIGFSQIESNFKTMIFYKQGIGVNVSMTLSLNSDFTFVEHSEAQSCVDRSSASNTISGVFKLEKNKIILTPNQLLYYDFQGNPLKIEGMDAILKSSLFFTEYEIVKYKDLILLLYDSTTSSRYTNDFINIANDINKKDGETEIRYIWSNKNVNSFKVDKEIVKKFPPPYNEYIINKPIIAKVIKTKTVSNEDKYKYKYKYLDDNNKYIYTLNIGKEDGIRNGMILYANGKNNCLCELIILEAESNQSIGFILQYQEEDCNKNTKYSTNQ